MSQISPLIDNNKQLSLNEGVFQNGSEPYRDSNISQELYDEIKTRFSSANSKGLFSNDLLLGASRDAKELLDPKTFQFLHAFDLSKTNNVLDLSQDTGGVAHFIADHVGPVDSINLDPRLARLSALRCANKPNVTVTTTELKQCHLPDNHYDLILISQLEVLGLNADALPALFSSLKKALSPNGIIVVNAKNSQRLTKILNVGDSEIPFEDAYEVEGSNTSETCLTRSQLRQCLRTPGFESCKIYANYAQAELSEHLFSEDYLTASVHALNHFYDLGCFDNAALNSYLLFQRLKLEKSNLVDSASRYVAIAAANKAAAESFCDVDFFYPPDQQRSVEFQSTLLRRRSAQTVERRFIATSKVVSVPYLKGELLAIGWLNALAAREDSKFLTYITDFTQWLKDAESSKDWDNISSHVSPNRLIVNPRNGDFGTTFNDEGQSAWVSAEFVLIRSLFWFARQNASLVRAYGSRHGVASLREFISHVVADSVNDKAFEEFVEREQSTQSKLHLSWPNNDIANALNDVWGQADSNPSYETKVPQRSSALLRTAERKVSELEIRIQDLLEHRSDLKAAVKRAEKQIKSERNTQGNLYAKIEHLEGRLHAQHVRNDELHHYLLQRPSSRIKRFARRWLDRALNRPAPEAPAVPLPAEVADRVEEVPFHDLPEGELLAMNVENYDLWIQENSLTKDDIERAKTDIEAMPYKPVFSILVPIYNTDPEYLLPMIRSVQNQIYPYWQLCLVDDSSPKTYLKRILEQESIEDDRICIKLNDVNQGISVTTNDALEIATGDYVALLDHDDEITIDALYENAKLINQSPESELIYSDEDKKEMDGSRVDPYFKPDYSPDLLDTNNYICHFTVIKKSLIESIGGFREGMDGSQDHDLILRATNQAKKVSHIPRILYHWRKIPGSTAVEYDSKGYAWEAGRKAIEDLRQRTEQGVTVEFGVLKGSYRVVREINGNPLVSIIIPFKDKPELLDACLNSILTKTTYNNFEVIGVSNNSEQELTHKRMAHFSELDSRVKFIEHNVPFNFSEVCNQGVKSAAGDYVVLLNNDIEIISSDWIERMLEHAQRDNVGAVGCKLLFPDGRIQHAGVVAGMVGAAGHPHKFFPESHVGYNGRLHMVSNVSAVTGAMLMVSKQKYQDVGGLDSDNLAVAYNDIDFCLKLLDKGLLNVFTPHAKAFHHESISRGYEDTEEKMQRLLKEQSHFLSTWKEFLSDGDPFYNPNLSLKNERFSLNFKD